VINKLSHQSKPCLLSSQICYSTITKTGSLSHRYFKFMKYPEMIHVCQLIYQKFRYRNYTSSPIIIYDHVSCSWLCCLSYSRRFITLRCSVVPLSPRYGPFSYIRWKRRPSYTRIRHTLNAQSQTADERRCSNLDCWARGLQLFTVDISMFRNVSQGLGLRRIFWKETTEDVHQ
jgi:hypothetical protein